VSGYRNTQDAIESVSTMKSEFDSMKGRTLEDMADMVQQFNSKIASKKAALEPVLREVRSVRQQSQVITMTYEFLFKHTLGSLLSSLINLLLTGTETEWTTELRRTLASWPCCKCASCHWKWHVAIKLYSNKIFQFLTGSAG